MAKLGKALLSLLLDEKARAALKDRAEAPKAPRSPKPAAPLPAAPLPAAPDAAHPSREELFARLEEAQQNAGRTRSPERQKLIQEAMRVRAAKEADVLADLTPEQKRKLQMLAAMSMLGARPRKGGN